MKQWLCMLLALLLVAPFATACSADPADDDVETTTASTETTEYVEPDPLAGLDFDGAAFRAYVSIMESYGVPSAAPMITPLETNGEVVNDTAYERNHATMDKLGVTFQFTECNLTYNKVAEDLRTIILSGDDLYDLVINDIYATTDLAVEGLFLNAKDGKYFDFTQDYWRTEYMEDISLDADKIYILNGDYFLDAICNAHTLFVNVDAFKDNYGSIDQLYEEVNTNKWTLDRMIEYVSGAYKDLDGDGTKNAADFYGFITPGSWGAAYPFIYGSDAPMIARDKDGMPTLVMNNEKVVALYTDIVKIFNTPGMNHKLFSTPGNSDPDYIGKFQQGGALFVGFSRLSSLATYREMEDDITLVPYPLMTDTQERYITVTDDEVEMGSIPCTTKQLDMISAVLEHLNATTGETVLKTYYETALKVKYTRDDATAQMLDLITGGLISSFPLAYNHALDSIFTMASSMANDNNTDFASRYAAKEAAAKAKLAAIIEAYQAD